LNCARLSSKDALGNNKSLSSSSERMVTHYFKRELYECVQLRSELLCILCTNFVHRRAANELRS
jgi:hypothetical protein